MNVRRAISVLACMLAIAASAPVHSQRGGIGSDVEIAQVLGEIEAGSAKEQRLASELEAIVARREQVQGNLRRQVRALYRMTRTGLAPVGGGFEAVIRHMARVKRLRKLVEDQSTRLTVLDQKHRAAQADSSKVSRSLERARARLTELQSSGRRAIATRGFDNVFSDTGAYRPASPAADMYGGGLRLVDPIPQSSFTAQRGSLASPVSGDVRIVSARRDESDGPGLEFQAPVGTPVRAVAAGRVAFSDRYGSYGRLVILDHGEGYYTVYGGLGAVEVRVGDDLSRNGRIGAIGTDYTPSAVFFEVRQGTRTLEPRGWLGF
jgi:septal ring factor EnvC (AmiA/AmiB activator)